MNATNEKLGVGDWGQNSLGGNLKKILEYLDLMKDPDLYFKESYSTFELKEFIDFTLKEKSELLQVLHRLDQ